MSYSPWTSGKLYLREAVITNPVEIVRKLETWNNFTAFKPGSTLCGANRCDDNSLILENSHSTGRGNYFSFIHPSLSRQTLSKATVSLSLSLFLPFSPFVPSPLIIPARVLARSVIAKDTASFFVISISKERILSVERRERESGWTPARTNGGISWKKYRRVGRKSR